MTSGMNAIILKKIQIVQYEYEAEVGLFPTRSEQLDLSNSIWLHPRSAQALVVVCDHEAAVLPSFCRRLEVPRCIAAGDIAAGSTRALGHTPFSLGHSRRADGMGAGCGRRWPAVP